MQFKQFTDIYKSGGFSSGEAHTEIYYAFEILFSYTYKDFVLEKELNESQIRRALKVFEERARTKRPLQQILGQSFFMGRRFYVNEYTLIPRPETELLVRAVLKSAEGCRNAEILDIGTGTGCIGISLMLENESIRADMSDIQLEALKTAEKNAVYHKVNKRAEFIHSDLFENIEKSYDIIVSNPPYIPLKDREGLQIEVRDYESAAALFAADDEGMEFYEKIIKQARRYLKPGGAAAFEAGINQAQKIKELMKKYGFRNIEIIKDLNNIERAVTAEI